MSIWSEAETELKLVSLQTQLIEIGINRNFLKLSIKISKKHLIEEEDVNITDEIEIYRSKGLKIFYDIKLISKRKFVLRVSNVMTFYSEISGQ